MIASTIPLIIFVIAAIALASTRRAWGPGTHIQLAQSLLDTMPDRLAPEQVDLLSRHADCFQYGCIAADIINLKQYGGLANHCHNWSIQERLAEHVRSETEEAFVWGYLCHLAADVVAHNHFVPFHLLYDLPPALLGHTYWEARADSRTSERTWAIVDALRVDPDLDSNDSLIHRAVPRKALSMTSNKFIFNHVLLARSKKSWREIMDRMRRRTPMGTIQEEFHDRCLERCLENMFDVFDRRALLELRGQDPTGHGALRAAREIRRELIANHGNRRRAAASARVRAEQEFGLG
ncbi:MAG: zinc dependent phospholipase C family protein [Planctomycetes bacterium]|nr:zinc dependent phospholipase C family protein [Planctomycetota bacterium]